MEMSGRLHAAAALLQSNPVLGEYRTEYRVGLPAHLAWTFGSREELLFSARIRIPDFPTVSVVTVLTTLSHLRLINLKRDNILSWSGSQVKLWAPVESINSLI